jgi:hypothetical protein
MYVCPQCAAAIDGNRTDDAQPDCPYCGTPIARAPAIPWVDVARVTNLAEAGFLSDELVGFGIDARVHQLEEFSAITDRWETMYLIRVPSEVAREAAAHIRQHLIDEADESESPSIGFRFAADGDAIDPLLWRPVALVVLAGVASFMLGQRFSEQNVERRPPRNSLSTAVGVIGRAFVTEPAPGQPRHRLTLDRRRHIWLLDSDRDGDGIYDTTQRFPTHAPAW